MKDMKTHHYMNISNMLQQMVRLALCGAIAIVLTNCDRLRAHNHHNSSHFEYREIYLAEAIGEQAEELGLNTVDEDWPIWGHNLKIVLPDRPMKTIYAKVNGGTIQTQFCFTSETLYNYIEEYIEENYSGTSRRFAILPNDNSIVCQCSKCRAQGNTEGNASPAVIYMIRRLAKRFPKHEFFTSHYLTTRRVPEDKLPPNVGVLVSAINFPLSAVETPEEQKFERVLEAWKERTDRVYVWDYINNFDDYFTPYPIFNVMQRRLQLYERLGVKGVFLNGSGPEFSAFSRIKINVLNHLFENPYADWHSVLHAFCHSTYPVTGKTIEHFMLLQEKYVAQHGQPLPLYEGVKNSLDTHLPEHEFLEFYKELKALSHHTEGLEKKDIDMLTAALEMTALEIKRLHNDTVGTGVMLDHLSQLRQFGVTAYNEAGWTINQYINDYSFMCQHAKDASANLLRGVQLMPLSPLDPEYSDLSILTDGFLGIPSNYHCGNMINSAETFSIAVPQKTGMHHLRVCMTRNRPYHILFPVQVTLMYGDNKISSVAPKRQVEQPGHSFADFILPPVIGNDPWVLIIERNLDDRTMAIDEIEGF